MTLNEYIEQLIEFRDDNDAGDFEVIYGVDDEGNSFKYVHHDPSSGFMVDEEYLPNEPDFIDGYDESDLDNPVVCIN